jgi:hypothetical protein
MWPYFGGCSSLFNQPVAASDFSGSGRSQSRHWNVRRPLPPGGSARIKKAPQPGQVGRSAWPMGTIFVATPELRQFQNRSDPRMIIPKFYEFAGTVFWLADCGIMPGRPRHIPAQERPLRPPRWGRFFVQRRIGTANRPSAYFAIGQRRLGVAHWRKRNPPASRFNRYLAGWAFTVSVVLGTLVILSWHGRS